MLLLERTRLGSGYMEGWGKRLPDPVRDSNVHGLQKGKKLLLVPLLSIATGVQLGNTEEQKRPTSKTG